MNNVNNHEAGPLENNQGFIDLKELAKKEASEETETSVENDRLEIKKQLSAFQSTSNKLLNRTPAKSYNSC